MKLDDLDEIQDLAERASKKVKKSLAVKVKDMQKQSTRLTAKQEKFCQLIVKYADDVKRAYGEAGFSTAGKFWETQASRVRNHPKLRVRIAELKAAQLEGVDIDEIWLIRTAKKFIDRAYTLGDLKAGKDVLELTAKLMGVLKDKSQAAQPALMQNFNFLGNDAKADLARLAKAANVEVIDAEATPLLEAPPVTIEANTSTTPEGN